ncbi:PREDICTED: interferon-stimulated 20 kDa exonuclease-like 2 [Nanorana parkeri]|uniref:interferon-stimulated 20 kDa exonuclease-like 2 n=1 Tax=Nanorana parkeri TaxID=125878 RepID=UPI00085460FD|nr:PREDICTED: interferon-stimulated 20 kDa exonuclease-like 2 [Nanorana parkeri]
MADMLLNLHLEGGQSSKHAEHGNSKHRRFIKRRKFLEKKGFLKQKQLPQKTHNMEKRADSWGHGRHNGQQRTEKPHSNLFCSDQQLCPSRTVTSQSGTLSVSIGTGATHSRAATFTPPGVPPRGHCSSKPNSDGTDHPPPKPSLHQQNIGLLSEYESGIPSASSAPSYKVVAIDCEMVGTGPKGSISALARCSIVSYHGDVVYDRYIRPTNPITDYRTKWSGIRREHLVNAIPFTTAQKEILKILRGKIVIGHAIQNDYKALEYFHPKEMTRDTSKIPMLNRRAGFPEKEAASLKRLAKQLLWKDIQTGRGGHSSVEDAKTTMELYRIVEVEYERELASGQAHL